eukprot:752594-Hanusia_phi.AAC.8
MDDSQSLDSRAIRAGAKRVRHTDRCFGGASNIEFLGVFALVDCTQLLQVIACFSNWCGASRLTLQQRFEFEGLKVGDRWEAVWPRIPCQLAQRMRSAPPSYLGVQLSGLRVL